MAGTVLRLGWTDPLTDTFGPHPTLGPVLDLNDGVTFVLASPGGLEMPPPPRTLVTAGNMRSQGERGIRTVYRQNREVIARVHVGPMASVADLVADVRLLVAWLNAPPAISITAQYQPPGASAPVYLDVVGCAHDIPEDEGQWLRLQLEPVEIVLIARPGMRGDRVTLQNLALNPGFEAPSGSGVLAFADTFASANAYTVSGGTATVSAGTLTLSAGASADFGSPAWSAIQTWRLRFVWASGLDAYFYLHYVDGGNQLVFHFNTALIELYSYVASVKHVLDSGAVSLTPGTAYWFEATQFPTVPGDQADVQVTLYADAAGSQGAQIASVGPAATYDAATALSGRMRMTAVGAPLQVGGTAVSVHQVLLFGPGGWLSASQLNTATGPCACAWERDSSRTYPGGPVPSAGTARIDYPPAGSVESQWMTYGGGASGALSAISVAAGQVLGVVAMTRSAGLSSGATVDLRVSEFDATGTLLRTGTVTALAGNFPAWTPLAGTYTTGAGCVSIGVALHTADPTPSASAGATVWFDNVQVWNVTATGQSSMPYCELRFAQSPAQLVVSGIEGDLPAPAFLAFSTSLASWPPGSVLNFAIGRGARPAATALVAPSNGYFGTALSPTSTAQLDSASYGGYFVRAAASAGWGPRAFSFLATLAQGTYHLFGRFLTPQAQANLGNVQVRALVHQRLQPWYGRSDGTDALGSSYGPYTAPVTASNTWTVYDAGQVTLPPFPRGALTDPAQTYLDPMPQWVDTTSGGSTCQSGWQLLLPVDGSLLVGQVNNPANGLVTVAGQWLWVYADGLGAQQNSGSAWTYSVESAPTPAPARGGGGPGTQGTGTINVTSAADPYLTLDPSQRLNGTPINVLGGYIADGAAAVVPLVAEIQYSPLYLYPR